MQMTAGHAVAEVLAQLGVRKVIGVVGSCMLEILDGMYGREDIQFLSTRHEQAAALMADGYGRIAGKPGVCIATNGPGATNLSDRGGQRLPRPEPGAGHHRRAHDEGHVP